MRTVTYPARFEYLDEIRDFVAAEARQGGFDEKEIYSIQLAADEAASNIIEHAYEGLPDGQIELTCEVQGNSITITMRDHGKPFDPKKVKKPNLKASLSERQIGGLGIYLMHKLMDKVNYTSSGNGNLLVMTKRKG
jgi:anti-sigma regulatory factor (Ser/Thr protein kinase)